MRGKARTVVLLFSVGVWPGQLDGLPVWLGESTKFQRRRRRRRVAGMENRREQTAAAAAAHQTEARRRVVGYGVGGTQAMYFSA